MSEFNYESAITVRYRDIDAMRHVNNAVYVSYLEHARVNYIRDVLDVDLTKPGIVVASLDVDYKRPIEWGDDVTIGVRVTDVGRSSFTMAYEVRANGVPVATAETVQVAVDGESGGSRPVPDAWRDAIESFESFESA